MTMSSDPELHQRLATDPRHSAWVEANAGSGKTHVLVDRIARLLLEGTPPDRLLCLTFTRAAAAEMTTRLFKRLGDWTLKSDEDLATDLAKLTQESTTPARRARARRLFAEAVESPGGLRIQTIHAFCERLLKRFPLEAGVAPQFAVLDDAIGDELLGEARDEMLRVAQSDPALNGDLYDLTAHSGEERFDHIMRAVARDRGVLIKFINDHGTLLDAEKRIFRALDAQHRDTETLIYGEASSCLTPELAARIADAFAQGTTSDHAREAKFRHFAGAPGAATFKAVADCLLTEKGKIAASLATKQARAADHEATDNLSRIADVALAALTRSNALFIAGITSRLMRVSHAMLDVFRIAKRRRAALDYDDLIARVRTLFESPGAHWVLYKLDGGIDHILVDEAQDTSPAQWSVITPIAQEFFTGQGAERKGPAPQRTFFAVGDLKQSIMSFQGADPEAFARTRQLIADAATGARLGFESVALDRSFRSAPAILEFVDAVFAQPAAQAGVVFEDRPVEHVAVRSDMRGLVELWPALPAPETADPVAWDAPRDRPTDKHPVVKLATQIADKIDQWIKSGEAVCDSATKAARPVHAGDIMVLVRRRTLLAEEIIRQLKKRSIAVAGADRLKLASHIAVKDLIALGRFALMPLDDLTLAALLKSPLCGLSEDALFELAYDRGKKALWDRLRERKHDLMFRQCAEFLMGVRNDADYKPPYEFYAHILGAQGGWRHVLARLGQDAADPIDEFLNAAIDHESEHTPSLEGFLHWIETSETEIKRDQDRAAGAVRVMTVHAAKGLEAPIVILPDTCTTPENGRHDLEFLDADGVPLWKIERPRDVKVRADAREVAKAQRMREYRRLLYVALTRPRDRLYVCGYENKTGRETGCWFDLVKAAMAALNATEVIEDGATFLRFGSAPLPIQETPLISAVSDQPLPLWARSPAATVSVKPPLSPSEAVEHSPVHARERTRGDGGAIALERGRVIHRLLDALATVDRAAWDSHASALSSTLIDDPVAARSAAEEAVRVRSDPAFAHLFAPGSHGEVALRGRISWREADVELVARIDRIVVEPTRVLIVEFKTDRRVPDRPDGISQGYVTQLALYARAASALFPNRQVDCAVLWTAKPRLDTISSKNLEAAVAVLDPPRPPS